MNMPINYNDSGLRTRHHALTHNWSLVITASNNLPEVLQSALQNLKFGDTTELDINCQSVSLPNTNISTVEGNVRGVRFHQIQTRATTQIVTQMLFYEPHDYSLYRFFELWKTEAVRRFDGSQNPDAKISDGVSIRLYDSERENCVLEYPLYETYCQSAQISDPSGTANLQTTSVVLVSSNYGIIAYNGDGTPAYANVATNEAGYLGIAKKWVTATGATTSS